MAIRPRVKACCCRSLPRTLSGRSFLKSSSARATKALARATSRRCSNRSSWIRCVEASFKRRHMKRPIVPSRVEGTASRQAHADLPPGTYEREISKEGFFGPAAFFHHRHPPTGWVEFTGPLRPHAFDLNQVTQEQGSPWQAVEVLRNPHVRIRVWNADQSMEHLVRNADGDDLLFVHRGAGELYCDYGRLVLAAGDYVMIPRGT